MTKTVLRQSTFLAGIQNHQPQSTAVVDSETGRKYSYLSLTTDVANARRQLLSITGRDDTSIAGERVAFMVENGYSYVVTLLAIMASNAIAVPLAPAFPILELRHVVNDSGACCLLWSSKYAEKAKQVVEDGIETDLRSHQVDHLFRHADKAVEIRPDEGSDTAAGGMMLYTSGTTARPKGVLLSIDTLEAQAASLVTAWKYDTSDYLLHVLPLHHIHGTVNALLAPLLAGCSIEFMYPFNAEAVWTRLAEPFMQKPTSNGSSAATNGHPVSTIDGTSSTPSHQQKMPVTFLTAVPTIWSRMLHTHLKLSPAVREAGLRAIARDNLRLNISGSAALPKPIRDGWSDLSNDNILLERYGMTEVGMALSCGLDDRDRIADSVGWPLPSVEARLWEADGEAGAGKVIEPGEEVDPATGKERQGEIQLRGPTIFREYWRNPEATKKELTDDGWFKTGDIAIRRAVPGAGTGKSGTWAKGPAYFIQGRSSADIIKTGGEKVSALEIERELLSLPQVSECAVVGLPSGSWGQKVVAVVVLSEEFKAKSESWALADIRRCLKQHLVPYKIPQDMEIVSALKRNAMGKVNKKELIPTVFGDEARIRRRSMVQREEKERLKDAIKQ